MTITITEKEYNAIHAVLDQVETSYEGASDPDYLKTMGESISLVYSVIRKYKKARGKANYFQSVRAEVSRHNRNRGLRPRDIDKLTRKVIKKIKEKGGEI